MSCYTDYLQPETFAIFLFHGVIHHQKHRVRNYTRKHIEQDEFAVILDQLAGAGTCVSMDEIVRATERGASLPARAFAITFDDGFANNLTIAAPLLHERGLAATFYLTSGFIDENSASWTDLIEYALEQRESVALELAIGHRTATTDLEKVALLDELRGWLKAARDVDPYAVADEVWMQLGITDFHADDELDRKMTWEEARHLDEDPLFTVGGHGHTHRILERLSDAELHREITLSVGRQKDRLGTAPRHYSYPEGLADCYSERVITALRAAGIACSPTAQEGVNVVGDDLFRLRRVMVPVPPSSGS
jgi:peptidoglycan/xylan/chitin deacetylase (PgdA/CDA1 family)